MRVLVCVCLFLCMIVSAATAREPLTLRLTQTITIDDGQDKTVFCAHAATDEQSRITGLMFQESLPADAGMVFDFGSMQIVNMWMRNTILPLDMIFFDDAGRVVSIAENTTPFSLDIISSQQPAKYVLEVNAGSAKKHGLNVGDQVTFGDNKCALGS